MTPMTKDVNQPTGAGPTLPAGYAQFLGQIKAEVRSARLRAQRVVNTELLRLYWTIGATILDQQAAEGWGTKVIDRLADDLRREFPDMTGLSRSNLEYMRRFADAYPAEPAGASVPPQAVGELPWGHVRTLLDKVSDPSDAGLVRRSSGRARLVP